MKSFIYRLLLVSLCFSQFSVVAQNKQKRKHSEWYFSWGYNTEWYTKSNLHVSQPELGNNYTMRGVVAHDNRGWDNGLFKKALTIPQYNYRIGMFLKNRPDLGIEINFDHTKYIITEGQGVKILGSLGNRSVDTTINFRESNGFFYFLNNGANFLLFNIVKRKELYLSSKGNFKLDFLGKAGIGPLVPHVENSLFGQKNDPLFQIGGWNVGTEGALKASFYRHFYLEFAGKLDYARYSHLHIYKGFARQAFGTAELIMNAGWNF